MVRTDGSLVLHLVEVLDGYAPLNTTRREALAVVAVAVTMAG